MDRLGVIADNIINIGKRLFVQLALGRRSARLGRAGCGSKWLKTTEQQIRHLECAILHREVS